MKVRPSPNIPLVIVAALALGVASAGDASGQSVATTPVGAVRVTISGSGNGTAYNISQVCAPLLKAPLVLGEGNNLVPPSGLTTGTIGAITSTTIQVVDAGWTTGELAQTGFPIFIKITTGQSRGRYFYITGNTSDTLTVAAVGTNPTLLDLAVGAGGDNFRLFGGDTLLTLFGGPADGIIGGTPAQLSAGQVDRVAFNSVTNNTTFTYYYNTDAGQWRRSGSSQDQGHTVVAPYTGILYSRISTEPLIMTMLGAVPTEDLRVSMPLLGVTVFSSFFPADTSLAALNLHQLSNWRKAGINGVTIADSDKVILKNGLTTFAYYYDGNTNYWKRSGSSSSQNSEPVLVGSSIRIQRSGQNGQFEEWNFAKHYNL